MNNVGPQLKQSIASHLHELLEGLITSANAGVEPSEDRLKELEELVEDAEEFAAEWVDEANEEIEHPPELVSGDQPVPPPLNEEGPDEWGVDRAPDQVAYQGPAQVPLGERTPPSEPVWDHD